MKQFILIAGILGAVGILAGCASVRTTDFDAIKLYTLQNKAGMTVKITNYGATVSSIVTADRAGKFADIALGYNDVSDYMNAVDKPYFGAIVGRYGNRIAKGRFSIDGKEYKLATNNGENHLHGGVIGFDKVIWDAEIIGNNSVRFSYLAKDGEEGYPGRLDAKATYTLTPAGELIIEMEATTDAPTIVNLVNHSYWNLGGQNSGSIRDHELAVEAEHGFRHSASMYSRNIDRLSAMARAFQGSIFVKNGWHLAGHGAEGEGYTSMTIASPTGEGVTQAADFTRVRRCVLKDRFRII